MNDNKKAVIDKLRKEKDVVIMAHYYVDGDVQEIADYVGDSYYLSKIATSVEQENILFCGVNFMGESAKILNPKKNVYMVDDYADCPMAHMVTKEKIEQVKKEIEDVCVVCYVNSTAEIKSVSDVCVTSSNAVKVVSNVSQKNIFFVPDNNLARYVAKMVPQKNFIFNDGYCHVHKSITAQDVINAKNKYPDALVLTHPECTQDIVDLSDYIGSTSEIIDYATSSDCKEFIICTETGVFYELELKNPDKKFYTVKQEQICPNMKKVTIDKLIDVMENMNNALTLSDEVIDKASKPLKMMLELAAK